LGVGFQPIRSGGPKNGIFFLYVAKMTHTNRAQMKS
jgi:hypothetical protein